MKKRKPRRMKPYTPEWEALANEEARLYAPPIYPCADCGGPVIRGYGCSRCGSADPEGSGDRRADLND